MGSGCAYRPGRGRGGIGIDSIRGRSFDFPNFRFFFDNLSPLPFSQRVQRVRVRVQHNRVRSDSEAVFLFAPFEAVRKLRRF